MKKILFLLLFMSFSLVYSQKTTLSELLFLREKGNEKEIIQTFEEKGWKKETHDTSNDNKKGLLIFVHEEAEVNDPDWSLLKFYFINNQKNENQIEYTFLKKEIYDSYVSQIELSEFKLIDSFKSSKWTKSFYKKGSTIITASILKIKAENAADLEFYDITLVGLESFLKRTKNNNNNR